MDTACCTAHTTSQPCAYRYAALLLCCQMTSCRWRVAPSRRSVLRGANMWDTLYLSRLLASLTYSVTFSGALPGAAGSVTAQLPWSAAQLYHAAPCGVLSKNQEGFTRRARLAARGITTQQWATAPFRTPCQVDSCLPAPGAYLGTIG